MNDRSGFGGRAKGFRKMGMEKWRRNLMGERRKEGKTREERRM
jgi:hypothetical protein